VIPHVAGAVVRAEIVDSTNQAYCYIPDDPFMCGMDFEMAEIHTPYYLAKFPVTIGQFIEFLEDSNYDYPAEDMQKMESRCPKANCPAVNVSWADARAYCQWMRRKTGEYYNLPSDLEWEKAARGIDGRIYPWGHERDVNGRSHYQTGDVGQTVPVDTFKESAGPYGNVDMAGNAWEWVMDIHDAKAKTHLLRGGSWCNGEEFISAVSKTFTAEERRVEYAGFRLLYIPSDMMLGFFSEKRKHEAITETNIDVASLRLRAPVISQDESEDAEPKGPMAKAMARAASNKAAAQKEAIGELSAAIDSALGGLEKKSKPAPKVETEWDGDETHFSEEEAALLEQMRSDRAQVGMAADSLLKSFQVWSLRARLRKKKEAAEAAGEDTDGLLDDDELELAMLLAQEDALEQSVDLTGSALACLFATYIVWAVLFILALSMFVYRLSGLLF
jgi:serine/threonine-protein kinase